MRANNLGQIDHHAVHLRRYNNFALRYLQLGLQLFICKTISEVGVRDQHCKDGILGLVLVVAILLIVANVGFLLFLFLKKQYIKTVFYFVLGV